MHFKMYGISACIAFVSVRGLCSLFGIPYRELFLITGACSSSKKSIVSLLKASPGSLILHALSQILLPVVTFDPEPAYIKFSDSISPFWSVSDMFQQDPDSFRKIFFSTKFLR